MEKTLQVTMRANVGGPDYTVLETGETYDLAEQFVRSLVQSGRAVLADGSALEDPGVVTLNGESIVPDNRAAKAPRKR